MGIREIFILSANVNSSIQRALSGFDDALPLRFRKEE